MSSRTLVLLALFVSVGAVFLWGINRSNPEGAGTVPVVNLQSGDTYELVAAPVRKMIGNDTYDLLAYNGSVPGPTIRVERGATVTLRVVNNTEDDTTLHAHGIRMPNQYDGVPGVTQKPIRPGEWFDYTLTFPDAGIFWYHPHLRTDRAIEHGLYGAIVVEEGPEPVNEDVVLLIDDLLVIDGIVAAFPKKGSNYALMGRFGNTMLVNGTPTYRLELKQGAVARLKIVNTANARTFNLSIPGARLKLVGSDGGRYEREQFVGEFLVSPGERMVVDAYFESAGTYALEHNTPTETYTLGTFAVDDSPIETSFLAEFESLATNDIGRPANFASLLARAPDKTLALTMDMVGMQGMTGTTHVMPDGTIMGGMMHAPARSAIEWEDDMPVMNEMSTSDTVTWKLVDEATKKENRNIDWSFARGEIVKVRVKNVANSMHPMQHPLHVHGLRFLVLAENGVQNGNLAWKDTALIKTGDTLDLAIDMSNPGTWMFHCHILEHAESGMMLHFTVRE